MSSEPPAPDDRRWRRAGFAVAVAAAVLVVAGVGVALSGAFGAEEPAGVPHRASPLQPSLPPPPTTAPGRPVCRTPLTEAQPLRLWIAGDSLAGSLGPALGLRAGNTGVVAPVFDSHASSGLANPGFFDWTEHATKELARLDPEVVVFIIGANDWSAPANLPVDQNGDPAWRARYVAAVDQMLSILVSGGRRVFWVSAPILQDPAKDRGVRQVNEIARARVEQQPDATFVDAYSLFADESGRYTSTLPNAAGRRVLMRTDDGVHFTANGAELIGAETFKYLDDRCRLTDQAVPGAVRPVVESPGSGGGGVVGVGSAGGGGGVGSQSVPTTTPLTSSTVVTRSTTTTSASSVTTTSPPSPTTTSPTPTTTQQKQGG